MHERMHGQKLWLLVSSSFSDDLIVGLVGVPVYQSIPCQIDSKLPQQFNNRALQITIQKNHSNTKQENFSKIAILELPNYLYMTDIQDNPIWNTHVYRDPDTY